MTFTGEYTGATREKFPVLPNTLYCNKGRQTSVENVPDCQSEDTGCSVKELKYHIKASLALM